MDIIQKNNFVINKRGFIFDINLMQFTPMKRTIFVDDENFYLPFPYLLFQFCCERDSKFGYLSVAFTSKPIISLDQIIYFPWLSNIYSDDWSVCLVREKLSNIKSAINRFWNSSFDGDEEWEGDEVREDVVGSYENWARLSLNAVCERVSKGRRVGTVKKFLNDSDIDWSRYEVF
jgi:hypothetical protein